MLNPIVQKITGSWKTSNDVLNQLCDTLSKLGLFTGVRSFFQAIMHSETFIPKCAEKN